MPGSMMEDELEDEVPCNHYRGPRHRNWSSHIEQEFIIDIDGIQAHGIPSYTDWTMSKCSDVW